MKLQSGSTLLEIQLVVPAIWYGCQIVSRPSGSKGGRLHGENICSKRTTELHHEELHDLWH